MLNKKVILVCGYSRGGTNILWNILQAHPAICSPKHETGTIFHNRQILKLNRFISVADRLGVLETSLSYSIIDFFLYRYKMETLKMIDNRFKTETETYSQEEVSKAALCLKSVDYDIFETDLLLKVYPGMYIILLTRNGYAVANGHVRRGMDVKKSAFLYAEVGRKMNQLHESYNRTLYIRFEDVIKDPFKISEQLFEFVEVEPTKVDRLRLKSKSIINDKQKEAPRFGEMNRKYWFDREEAVYLLDSQINQKQIALLEPSQIKAFNEIAAEQLKSFGYDILNPSDK